MENEERFRRIEEAILTMKDLVVRHEEQLGENYFEFKNEKTEREESRKDFDFKFNALIDSQIRSESEIIEIKEAIKELKEVSQ
jgi:hypothetical protein